METTWIQIKILAWGAIFTGLGILFGKHTGERIWFIVSLFVMVFTILMSLEAREQEKRVSET
jgi:hypothetical protein